MFRKIFVLATTLMVFSVTFTGSSFVLAQQGEQRMQPAQPQMQSPEIKIDEKMLNKFIAAAKEIEGIKAEYTKKLQGMKDKTKAMEFQQKAQDEVNKVLKKHQFDPQTYNSIGNAVTQNPELMKKVQKELSK
jgi:hypothetical protein